MRLTCPNCRAQYEVDAAAIPARGRDVQCSSCGHGWFQKPAEALQEAKSSSRQPTESPAPPEQEIPAAVATAAAAPPKRKLDPAIAEVLRAEAEREARVRQKETADLVETQQEFALPEAPAAAASAPPEPAPVLSPAPASFAQAKRSKVPRRDLLPDIEEINSSLRAKSVARIKTADDLTPEEREERQRRGRGFRIGFSGVLLVALFLILAYSYAPLLAERVPGVAPLLDAYVTQINDMRMLLNRGLVTGTEALNGVLSGIGG